MICNKCNGTGEVIIVPKCYDNSDIDEYYYEFYTICNKCLEKGELDWLDNIIPPKHNVMMINKRIVYK
jgi:RecJ-like exonuclease